MSLHRNYNGFEVNARAMPLRSGWFSPMVVITKHNGDNTKEIKLEPACANGYATAEEAIIHAMDYGLEAVDGNVKGFDPNSLR